MPQQGLIYRVLIASPSDVTRERQIITDTIHSWNATHSRTTAAILEPVKWETHSRPALGDRPQEIINQQLVQYCDFLIGAFWTRLGTSTGEAASGTVEEIEQLRKVGKPVLLYFSSAPVVPDSLDAEQYKALSEYKASLKSAGLYSEYDDIPGFQIQVQRHLASTMSELHHTENYNESKDNSVFVSPKLSRLSEQAKELLLEAAQDTHGMILHMSYIGGEQIQTNNKTFGASGNSRETAHWNNALKQLTEYSLIEAKGNKGEIFQVTAYGYEVADILKET